ncbi:MAG: hypothetical protein HFI39_15240 [Lachnospiraceae bacterium]|nr:hypothetical protein [Lachnospiraceae bacterium]
MRINTLFGTKELTEGVSGPMTLSYYLVQETGKEEADAPSYGIGIVKETENGGQEKEWIPGISRSRKETEQLLRRMMAGTVTPVSAVSVVDDYLGMQPGERDSANKTS